MAVLPGRWPSMACSRKKPGARRPGESLWWRGSARGPRDLTGRHVEAKSPCCPGMPPLPMGGWSSWLMVTGSNLIARMRSLVPWSPTMTCIARLRTAAFTDQRGLCFYCHLPMWLRDWSEFARAHQLTRRQAQRFRCTAEHLTPRSMGGPTNRSNIAAACWHCNHLRGASGDPVTFGIRVRRKCSSGKWHSWPIGTLRS